MNVPAKVFASKKILKNIKKDESLKQLKNVACLPGIIKHALCMPDCHQGYGFPIGGVAAFDLDTGIVSPGGVGFDINCGVRILATNILVEDFKKIKEKVVHDIARTIPTGVGRGNKVRLKNSQLDEILVKGAKWAVESGFGSKKDLNRCEENGCISGVDLKDVSVRAKARGLAQMGTLGAGNHFLEVQAVDEMYDSKIAKTFGLKKGTVAVMIHCGSRGLGHQVASDYIQAMEEKFGFSKLTDRQLVNAPIKSELGQKYFSAMNAAVNFAFCNRQIIMNKIQEILTKHFPKSKTHLVYDVCHNIAKIEKHLIDGKMKNVCIHRKGATRSFGPGRAEIPKVYRKVGQPVIIPGSMGTASYVLVGTKKAEEISFSSTAHGAGRVMSRSSAVKNLNDSKIREELLAKDICIECSSAKGIVEEAPEVYKDINEVIEVSDSLGLARKVVKMRPLGVVKG